MTLAYFFNPDLNLTEMDHPLQFISVPALTPVRAFIMSRKLGNSTPIRPLIAATLKKKKNNIFLVSFISGVYLSYINKMIKFKKKPLNFLMQPLQFLIPGKVWGIP
jgi:hypothetical protein